MKALIRISLLVTFASVVWAQATAQIHGTVQDTSASAVPCADSKNWPAEPMESTLDELPSSKLSREAMQALNRGNAERLFPSFKT